MNDGANIKAIFRKTKKIKNKNNGHPVLRYR
jgi:hypothetical protein